MKTSELCRNVKNAARQRLAGLTRKPVCEADLQPVWLDDQEGLEGACREFMQAKSIGVDTEFVRVRTFFPQLGLIQLSHGRKVYLVDPLALSDLSCLAEVLLAKEVTKVFHSCSEDLEVLSYLCGEPPGPVFDTQVAAAFLGYGFQIGYQALAEEVLGASMEKGETRSNWLKRPLSEDQVRYAAMDVACLLPLAETLARKLSKKGRLAWAEEEFSRIRREARGDVRPEDYYLRFGWAWQYSRRDLAVLRDLFTWREQQAVRRDLPRSFVMPDKALRALSKAKPTTLKELAAVEGMRPSDVRRHGKKLTRIIQGSLDLPESELPPRIERPPHPRKVGKLVDKLRPTVKAAAARLELPPELVARKKSVTELVHNELLGRDNPLPPEMDGWRREVVGEALVRLLRE